MKATARDGEESDFPALDIIEIFVCYSQQASTLRRHRAKTYDFKSIICHFGSNCNDFTTSFVALLCLV